MQTYTLSEAKAKFSQVIDQVLAGEEIMVTRMGKPAVQIIPATPKPHKQGLLGLFKGEMRVPDDFDEWPEDMQAHLGMRE